MENMFEETTIKVIRDFLLNREETIAVAESVTSGYIQLAFSTAEEASQFYQGGITAYNVGQKYKHLHIEPIHALATNCVSEDIAKDMAINVCSLFESDWGIGITGYAVPVPESNNEIFAYYAIAFKDEIVISDRITAKKEESIKIQLKYVNHILEEFKAYIKKKKAI